MKCKKIIAIATAAAFALTGTAYADTGENLATEGSDVTAAIEDISLTGERIEADDTSYYTSDVTVNFSLYDETGISSVAVLVNGEKLAEKKYDTSDCIETADGEVMNAGSTVASEGADAQANTIEPVTTVSDSLVISADDLKTINEAKATEPVAEVAAEEPSGDVTAAAATEAATDSPAVEADAEPATEPEAESAAAEPETEPATEPVVEPTTEPAVEASGSDIVSDSGYNAELVITDVNGNTETKTFDFNAVNAETAEEQQEAVSEFKAAGLVDVQVIDATTYRVEVNLTRQAVTFYKKDQDGNYNPIKVVVCSTGRSGETTPTGTFTIGPYKKKCAKSKWALLSGGSSFAQYLVRIHHGICFHSVPYKARGDNSKMYRSQYNKLGSVASAGCVRLRVVDAKWIYDNCPTGTVVKIYRSSTASPLGAPTYKKLSSGSSLCWDPTDPDTGNPANGGDGTPTGIYVAYEGTTPVLTVESDLTKHLVKLSKTRYVYNGKVFHPSVSIYGLTKDTNFTVTYPKGCKDVGRYDITIEGIGSFTGTQTATFRIYPMSTKITKVSRAGSKKFKVQYKKIAKQATGYQIKYSTSSKFSKNCKTATVKGFKTISKTIKVPKKGTYYVKVRVYKINAQGYKYYSSWSAVKKIKVK